MTDEAVLERTPLELLREVVAELPDEDDGADDFVIAALGALSDPEVMAAAMAEQATIERLAAAQPHLVAFPRAPRELFEDPDDPKRRTGRQAGNLIELFEDVDDPDRVTGRRLDVTDCPDCTRGTWSLDGVLVCLQIPRATKPADAEEGDIIACGRER